VGTEGLAVPGASAGKTLTKQSKHIRWLTCPPRLGRTALPADGLLAPGAHNRAIPLAGEHVAGVMQNRLDLDEEGAGGADQVATARRRAMTVRACRWGCHTISPPEKDVSFPQRPGITP